MDDRPGKGLFGWLGRQVGYVRRAVRTDAGARRVYRQQKVEEQPLPQKPHVKLRRTTVDEVIIEKGRMKDEG
jgi:hypothetical protein